MNDDFVNVAHEKKELKFKIQSGRRGSVLTVVGHS